MKIVESKSKYSRRVDIQPFDGVDRTMVTVSQHASLADFKWGEAYVSWSAIGDVTADQAVDFAEALKRAAKFSEDWNVVAGSKVGEVI